MVRHHEISPFILCGGIGTRLWPLSREALPKQFHKIIGPETLFQQTCRRLTGDAFGDLYLLCNHRHRFVVAEQLEEIGRRAKNIMVEPVGRSTGPAACIAALVAAKSDPKSLVLLAPADHMISNADSFVEAVRVGIDAARRGALVIFGVEPDCAHTGYGYVETDKAEAALRGVKRFVEKPSRKEATDFLDSGRYYWNAGIFLFEAAVLLEQFEIHAPDVLKACRRALDQMEADLSFLMLGESYGQAPAISLDNAIAEKANNLVCVPLNTAWSDVGSWSEVWNVLEKDPSGNVARGEGKVILKDTKNSLAYSDHACVALLGVDDLVVVAMDDAVLVAAKDHAEAIKAMVQNMKGNGQDVVLQHSRVYRPWGWYQGLNRGDRYQVKCIMVKPGGQLSLQSHHHRSEHWVVVKGTLEVTKGEQTSLLTENQSTYIPIGEKHRLANPGKIPAFLIEVQSGPYLDEDDITRFEDTYHRD